MTSTLQPVLAFDPGAKGLTVAELAEWKDNNDQMKLEFEVVIIALKTFLTASPRESTYSLNSNVHLKAFFNTEVSVKVSVEAKQERYCQTGSAKFPKVTSAEGKK